MELFWCAHYDDIVRAHFVNDPRAQLLISSAKDVALTTDGGDDDLGVWWFNELQ
jgi:hypothetical protein